MGSIEVFESGTFSIKTRTVWSRLLRAIKIYPDFLIFVKNINIIWTPQKPQRDKSCLRYMLRNSPIKVLFDIIKCKYSKDETKVLKQASKISQLSCKLTFGI